MSKRLVQKIKTKPETLFLIDGFGALLSTSSLVLIVARFHTFFGLPQQIIYYLAFVPVTYAIYSFSCYFLIKSNYNPFLKTIAIANLLYCFITIGLLAKFIYTMTLFSYSYFIFEFLLIIFLTVLEWKSASKNK